MFWFSRADHPSRNLEKFFIWKLDKFILFTHSLVDLGLVQTPYFSCAEPNWISSTLERHLRNIWFRRRTVYWDKVKVDNTLLLQLQMWYNLETQLRPNSRINFSDWKQRFFLRLAYRPLVSREKGHRQRIFSKTLSRVEIFKNTGFSFTRGRTKIEVFEYDHVMHHILQALRMLWEGCYRISVVLAF